MDGWDRAPRILCIRLDNAGDVLMTTPALRAVKCARPKRHITLLTSTVGGAVARHVPEVDEIICFDAPWIKNDSMPMPAEVLDLRSALANRKFDAAIIFTVYSQNPLPAAMLCYLAGIPLRLAHCRENPYRLLTDWVRETEPHERIRHEVERQLDLVATIGARPCGLPLSFTVSDDDRCAALEKLRKAGIDPERPWLAIHPGASAPSRRYPADRFARVARELSERLECQVVLTGDAGEAALAEQIRNDARTDAASLAGELELNELGALIAMSPLLISNNTGPVHIAAAVGTPVVDLYALTNPQHTPWQVPNRVLFHDVPCKNCYRSICPMGHHACLRGVAVETVVAAALELWAMRFPINPASDQPFHDHAWHQRRLPRLLSLHRA